jgi:hypothetical protein
VVKTATGDRVYGTFQLLPSLLQLILQLDMHRNNNMSSKTGAVIAVINV